MSESKQQWTPGPWSVWTSNSYRRIGSDSTGQEVCYGSVQRDGHPDLSFLGGFNGPNAKLIAAAPDLVEALQAAEDWLTSSNSPADLRDKIRAALAKAGA